MTTLINDTFTDAEDTLLGSHVGETNAQWVSNTGFGSGTGLADEFVVKANRMRRVNFDAGAGYTGGGEALAYSATSADLGTSTNYDIDFVIRFDTGHTNSALWVYKNAAGAPTAGDILASFTSGGGSGSVQLVGETAVSYTFTDDQSYEVKLAVRGGDMALYVAGSMISTTSATAPAGKLGFDLFDTAAVSYVSMDTLLVTSVTADLFRDEFDGTEDLGSHTSDSGVVWTNTAGTPGFLDIPVASGYASTVGTTAREAMASATFVSGAPEVEFSFLHTGVSTNAWFERCSLFDPIGLGHFGVAVRYLGGTTELWLYTGGTGPAVTGINPLVATPSALNNILSTVKLFVDGADLVIDLNGAEVYRAVGAAPDMTNWQPAIRIQSSSTGDTQLNRFVVRAISQVVSLFWTNFSRTQEIP